MYLNSDLALTATNIEAAEEYLGKAQMFHHLWQPDHEIEHIQKAILIHRDITAKKKKKAEQEIIIKQKMKEAIYESKKMHHQ